MLAWFQGDASEPGSPCNSPGDPLLVTDTAYFGGGLAICVRKDSVVFTQLSNLYLQIRPWTGMYLSVEEMVKHEFQVQVFPNPTKEQFTLSHNLNLNDGLITLVVYDVMGRSLITETIDKEMQVINSTSLKSGVYFYSVVQNNTTVKTDKLVIK